MDCTGCELAAGCKTVNMMPDESGLKDGRCDVMIIGEAPGQDEDLVGKPFVGASGSLLRMVVEDTGLDEFGLVYTNVVRCRPPNNATPSTKQIKACLPKLLADIDYYNPALIILLGNTPLKAVLGESGITNWRGATLERGKYTYLPTFHPAYILRNNSELQTLVTDIQKAYDVMVTGNKKSVLEQYDIQYVIGEQDAKEMYDAIKAAGIASFDTESRNAKPYAEGARMVMMSFAVDKPVKKAWAVIAVDDYRVNKYCMTILRDPDVRFICHNAKYDQHVIWNEWGIEVPNVVGDSMLASWMIDPTPGRHGLKHLAGRLLSMYEYNSALDEYHAQHPESDPSKGGDQALVPSEILAPYAAKDAIATLEIHKILYKQLTKKQKALYNQLIIPTSQSLWRMENNGVAIDPYIINRYKRVYAAIQQRQLDAMLDDETVKIFVTKKQRQIDKDWQTKYAGKTTRAKKPEFSFNPNSDLQMRELLYGKRFFNLQPQGATEKGEPSTKWEFLKGYAADNDNDASPFLKAYHYHSLLGKMLSTYVGPALGWRGADGRVRSTYNIHGTVSGRLSSQEPNLQNIPTPEKEPDTVLAVLPVKNMFTCTDWGEPDYLTSAERNHWEEVLGPYVKKGGVVLSVDYSGMELRTMASVSGCKGMMEIFERGDDVHRIVSAGIFNVPVSEVTKEMRYRGKWTNWTLLYGGSEYTFQRLYGIPLDEGKRFVKVYYDLFPEIRDYQEETKEFAHKNGYVESMFGHRRYLPFINDRDRSKVSAAERESVNHPIQSVASQMLLMGLIIIDDCLRYNDLKTKIVNTVHDSLMFDVPLYELKVVASLVKQVLEGLKDVYKDWFPDLDLSWFICPLKVDMEIGSHYGSLSEYEVEE